jgi:hypothetical protein
MSSGNVARKASADPARVEPIESSEPGAEALRSLFEAFQEVPDPRRPRGVRHPLASLLALCIVALICGRQNLRQIRRFGRDYPEI